MQKPIVVALVFSAVGLAAAPGSVSATPASFDGTWTVRLVTESGTCENSYSQTVAVENGRFARRALLAGSARMARWP